MKAYLLIIVAALLLLFFTESKGQTIYGVTGLLKTPTAYTVESGKCRMGVLYLNDHYKRNDELIKLWSVHVTIGFHSRFELGVRLAIFPDKTGDSDIFSFGSDRMISGKFILFEEKELIPQLSIGIQDIIGTRFHNSTYIVASKNIEVKSFDFTLNLGYGSKINELVFGDARDHHFIGVFGGATIGFKKTILLMAEHDAKDLNAGLRIAIKDWLFLDYCMLNMKESCVGFSLKFVI